MNNDLRQLLQKQVANFTVLYMKLHHYHWFIKGVHFFQLHEMFEKFYDETTEHLDALAERMLMLNEKPLSTLKEALKEATIEEAIGEEDEKTMLETVIQDFELIIKDLKNGINYANDDHDDVTVDLFVGIIASFEKHLWMLKTTIS